MNAKAFHLDPRVAQRHFAASAAYAASGDFLAREVSQRLAERLDYIRFTPNRILDLGCGCGTDTAMLAERYPQAQRLGIDYAMPQLYAAKGSPGLFQRLLESWRKASGHFLCATADALPLATGSMQMIWSNQMLQWLADPAPALREMHRVLEVGGLLMCSTLGPDTLKELREALPAHCGERVHRFIDMHDLGDALVAAGFADPVMDMQTLTLTYERLDDLLRDIRLSGGGNASLDRPRGLCGKDGWRLARSRYEALRQDGRLPATVEVVFGHAWKAASKTTADGRSVINFHKRSEA